MEVEIVRMDHQGRGIGYIGGKIIFVPKTIIGDIIKVKITNDKKNYMEGKVERYLKKGNNNIKPFCPYYDSCSGCSLQNFSYEDTCQYKQERIQNIFNKINYDKEIVFIKNDYPKNYRNKIEIKIKDNKMGYFKEKSHEIVEIRYCDIAKKAINDFMPVIKKMNLTNADITLRCNFNDGLLISINTKDKVVYDENDFPKHKVVGLMINDKCVYGQNYFLEKIQNYFFEVAHDAFFQVNNFINEKLFTLIKEYVTEDIVLDLYSGVGTLSIMASKTAKMVYAIENVPSAVKSGLKNAKINKRNKINFILGNVEEKINFIADDIDTIIVDPPRRGLDLVTIKKILELKPNKIIYISCENQKLIEDLKSLLNTYEIQKVYALDMFSYSYHTECVCILCLR